MTNDIKNRTEKFLNILFNKPSLEGYVIYLHNLETHKQQKIVLPNGLNKFYELERVKNFSFTPNVFKSDSKGRPKNEIQFVNAVYVDLDLEKFKEEIKEKQASLQKDYIIYSDMEEYLKGLSVKGINDQSYGLDLTSVLRFCSDHGIPLPSAVVWSGRGYHLYWSFTLPQVYSEEVEKKRLSIVYALLYYFKVYDADVPASEDLVKVLRVPGTFNTKDDVKKLVEVLYTSQMYDFNDLYAWAKEMERKGKIYESGKNKYRQKKYQRRKLDPEAKALFKRLLFDIGSKYWEKGHRHALQFSMAAILYYMGFSEEEIVNELSEKIKEWNKGLGETGEFLSQLSSQVQKMPQRMDSGDFSIFPLKDKLPEGYVKDVRRLMVKFGEGTHEILLKPYLKMVTIGHGKNVKYLYIPTRLVIKVSSKGVTLFERVSNTKLSHIPDSLDDMDQYFKRGNYRDILIDDILVLKLDKFDGDKPLIYRSILLSDTNKRPVLSIKRFGYWKNKDYTAPMSNVSFIGVDDFYDFVSLKLHKEISQHSKDRSVSRAAEISKAINLIYEHLLSIAENGPYLARVLSLYEHNDRIVLAKPLSLPVNRDEDYPKDEAIETYNLIVDSIHELTDEDRTKIGKALSYLTKPHDIIIAGHAIASLLRQVIKPTVSPHLFVIGKAQVGKTSMANIFALIKDKEARTGHQLLQSIHGFGCGTIVMDELTSFSYIKGSSSDLLDILKNLATNLLFDQEYGKGLKKRVGAVNVVITANSIPSFEWKSIEDREGLLRRFLAVYPRDEDQDGSEEVENAVKLLKDRNNSYKLLALIINYLMKFPSSYIRELYKEYRRKYGEGQYGEVLSFIYFGIDLYEGFLKDELNVNVPSEVFEKAKKRVHDDTVGMLKELVGSGIPIADAFYSAVLKIASERLKRIISSKVVSTYDEYSISERARSVFEFEGVTLKVKEDGDTIRVYFNGRGAKRIVSEMLREGINIAGDTGKALVSFLEGYKGDDSGDYVITKILNMNSTYLDPGDSIKAYIVDLKRLRSKDNSGLDYDNLIEGEQLMQLPYKDILKEVVENYLYSDFSYENLLNYLISRGFSKDHIDAFISEGLKNGDLIEIEEKRYRLSNPDGILNGSE